MRERTVDVVLVLGPDRLSRELVDQLILIREIERAGVRLEYVTLERQATPEGQLLEHVKGVIAH